jgi:putative ABC transport system permease protein
MLKDVRFATRTLARHPGYALVAIVTLALGIGANTALFSVADAVLLRPLPYGDVTRLVHIESAPVRFTRTGISASRRMESSAVFAGVGIYAPGGLNLGDGSHPERVSAAAVSAGFFDALGAAPIRGRTFTSAEADANERMVVIGHDLWRRRFAAGEVVGQTVLLNGQSYRILGVMPPRYDFPTHA